MVQPGIARERSEHTTSLSAGGIERRKISERSSVRKDSVQEKDPSQHVPLSHKLQPRLSMLRARSRWILPGVLLLASQTLSPSSLPSQARSTAAPSLTLPPSPLLPSPPTHTHCGLTQRNLKIRCDV